MLKKRVPGIFPPMLPGTSLTSRYQYSNAKKSIPLITSIIAVNYPLCYSVVSLIGMGEIPTPGLQNCM